jgi:hypothetical protein
MCGGWNPHRRELARAIATRKLHGVATVCLHSLSGLHRNDGGSDDFRIETQLL